MKKLTTCLVASGLALSGCASISGGGSKCSLENAKYTLTANELISTYESNPIAFDSQYKGTCVALTGAPIEISTTAGYSITLAPYSNNTKHERHKYTYNSNGPTVLAKVSEEEAKNLAEVRVKGALIRMTGIIGGSFDGIYVSINNAKLDPTFEEENNRRIVSENLADITSRKDEVIQAQKESISYNEKTFQEYLAHIEQTNDEICGNPKDLIDKHRCADIAENLLKLENGTHTQELEIKKGKKILAGLENFNASDCPDPYNYVKCFSLYRQGLLDDAN